MLSAMSQPPQYSLVSTCGISPFLSTSMFGTSEKQKCSDTASSVTRGDLTFL